MESQTDHKPEPSELCCICEDVFSGKAIQGPFSQSYWHHESYIAFQAAAQGICRLCFELWEEWPRTFCQIDEVIDQDIVIVCVAGTTTDSHSDREMNLIQFEIYRVLTDDRDSQKARIIEKGGFDYVQDYVVCMELQCIKAAVRPRSLVEIGTSPREQPSRDLRAKWFRDCLNHPECKPQGIYGASNRLPARVLEVGAIGQRVVRLHISNEHNISYAPYATLSYSWGNVNPKKRLTRDTEAELVEGVNVNELPNIFRNAIALTRELGFRFLWIDSMCIFQDSDDDWQRQSLEMGEIYKGCALSIAATSATDCGGKLFHDRNPRLLQPVQIYTRWPLYDESAPLDWYTCFSQAPYLNNIMNQYLNTRGWVLQERVLAPRILHCTEKELVWECNQKIATETFPDGILAGRDHHPSDRLMPLLLSSKLASREDFVHESWMKIVTQYSRCNLRHDADVLIALSGVAQEWQRALNDTYLAGLWKSHLQIGLLWYTSFGHDMDPIGEEPLRPEQYRAPSWSWASIKGEVQWSRELDPQLFTNNLDRLKIPLFDLASSDVRPKSISPMSQISFASITLSSNILFMSIDLGDTWFPHKRTEFVSMYGPRTLRVRLELEGFIGHGQLHIDDAQSLFFLEQQRATQIMCIPILLLRLARESRLQRDAFALEGLAVDLIPEPEGGQGREVYERIGHFRITMVETAPQHEGARAFLQPWEGLLQTLVSMPKVDVCLV